MAHSVNRLLGGTVVVAAVALGLTACSSAAAARPGPAAPAPVQTPAPVGPYTTARAAEQYAVSQLSLQTPLWPNIDETTWRPAATLHVIGITPGGGADS